MPDTNPSYGTFRNTIPYARVGSGKKTMLMFSGGPGNGLPAGFGLRFFTGSLKAFLDEYSLWIVTRISGMPPVYTTQDMSEDYAEMIQEEFGGHVAVAIGVSYGGLIMQHFAADHAGLCDHLVIAMATHKLNPAGGQLDLRYASLLSQGKERQAGVVIAEVLFPSGIQRRLAAAGLWLAGGSITYTMSRSFNRDVLIEADAELAHDSVESLKRITAPVLILVGGNDFYFSAESAQEMAAMIPSATLKIYPGKGHDILTEKRFAEDIAEFIAR